MKKHILSILLIVVLVLTMTACGAFSNAALSESTEPTIIVSFSAKVKTTEANSATEATLTTEEDLKIFPLNYIFVEQMSEEDISEYMEEMVNISSIDTLSVADMYQLGWNFYTIWVCSNNHADFQPLACEAFTNVYNHAIEMEIPLDELGSWSYIPVVEILSKYFSSYQFDSGHYVRCCAFSTLEKEDALMVAQQAFDNPFLKNSCVLAKDAVNCPYPEIQNLGIERYIEISNSSYIECSFLTLNICLDLKDNSIANSSLSAEKLDKIRENIMQNSCHNFVYKYETFCNSTDKNIANNAFNHLLVLAENADAETTGLIQKVADLMHDADAANELLTVLETNS